MASQQQQINYPNFNPYDPEQNGMNEYDRQTDEWNRSNQVQEMRERRSAAINNTPAYYTGDRIHHIRVIQMPDPELWNQLFGNENLDQSLLEYTQASLDANNDQTNTLLFAGQMEVSLLMEENFRPGVHVANFVVHMTPHRQFRDGHLIQMEFGEGSHTHQTVSRMFDLNGYGNAIVVQATEYQILEYLADDDEAMELLHNCFLQPDFTPMRFTFVEPVLPNNDNGDDNGDDYGHYVQNLNAGNVHRWHELAHVRGGGGVGDAAVDAMREIAIAIPPPPPNNNNFADIYLEQLMYGDDANYNNIIPYDEDDEDDEEFPAQG